MSLFSTTCILSFISTFFIGILSIIRGGRKKSATLLGLAVVASSIWEIGAYKFSTTNIQGIALFWMKIAHIGIIFTPTFYCHLVFSLIKKYKRSQLISLYSLAFFFLIIATIKNNFFNYHYAFNDFYFFNVSFKDHKLYIVFYLLFYTIIPLYTFIRLFKFYLGTSGTQRNQIKYILLGSTIAFSGPEGMFLYIIFGVPLYPYSNIFIGIYPLVLAYAMLRYRLMDINVAITRVGVFIAVYTIVLGLPFALANWLKLWLIDTYGSGWWMAPLILMAVLATAGPFIYIYLQHRAEDKLLREQRRYQDTLKQASVGMTRIRNLRKLLDLIAHIVTKTVKISFAAIYLYNEQTDEYILQVSRDKGRAPLAKIRPDNPLLAWVMVRREPLIYEEVKRISEDTGDETFKLLEENMRLLYASVIIPSFLEDKFIGFFVLGDKISGQIYTPDDLSVFQVLASQAALAIENAQFYEEAKEMQDQIAQAEKMATIGTMADGLSHQINNRFYALSLIAGDTIDTIKMTDTTKCTPEVKEMIDSINHALQRIQNNVIQGGEVVRGLLKYSRKGDASFDAVELNTIISNTLEMVQFKVKLSEIDIIRNFPEGLPKIKGNLVQLEEAFFNFIDNAYDAIVERRDTLKEPGYRGKITISAKPKENNLEILIEDNGMGVKDSNTNKVFTPFFTTKTSSRKGTGLGLYVIRRIITDAHKGKISFESAYKVGTRFILELPIAR